MIHIERAVIRIGEVAAVADLSFDAAPGEAWAVIGPGGCGKGALVAAIAGGVPLAGGEIVVAGRSMRHEPVAARLACGYVPRALEAWPPARADEFLDLFGAAAGLSGDPLAEARGRALRLAGLAGHERLDTLAEGAAKRLLLGRAVLHDPEILALDDPFRGLDPRERELCEKLIEAAVLVERTVVAAIDDAIVPPCFTHLAVMESGRIVARGPAHPAAFAPGRTWTWRVTLPRDAVAARECLADRVPEAHLIDDHAVECRIDPALSPPSSLIASLVRMGIPVESAGFHPSWTEQLVGEPR